MKVSDTTETEIHLEADPFCHVKINSVAFLVLQQ